MACCKVPIKISGFSGGCANVTTTTSATTLAALNDLDQNSGVSGTNISNLAYLGLKCVNIACAPALNVTDNLSSVAAFLNLHLTQVGTYRDSALSALTGAEGSTAIRTGIAALIAGCGCCSQ